MAFNLERFIGLATDYVGYAYLPQLIVRVAENALARGDLKKAIDAKCGSAGAANTPALEKELLNTDPMHRGPAGLPVSNMTSVRLPWRVPFTQWRMPIFAGPANPFLLTYSGVQAIQHDHERWGGAMIGASFLLADYNRGFELLSRVPFLNRSSFIGGTGDPKNLRYAEKLSYVTNNIQCNGGGGNATASEPETAGAPAMSVEPSAAVEAVPDSALIPVDSASLARSSLGMYGQGNSAVPVHINPLSQGASVLMRGSLWGVTPATTMSYTLTPVLKPISAFATSMVRPILVFEPATVK